MRALVVMLSGLLLSAAAAEARPSPRAPARQPHPSKQVRRVAIERPARPEGPQPVDPTGLRPAPRAEPVGSPPHDSLTLIDPYADNADADADADAPPEEAAGAAAEAAPPAPPRHGRGQSIGAPWAGRLQDATRLQLGDHAYIRRPYRAFGTKTTIDHVRRAVRATLAAFPKAHVLAIGDLSAEHGGWISEHSSHRSGRDIDLGLFYKKKPAGYPESFVRVTDENLDRAATWGLLANVLQSYGKDGGVQMIFLDYDVQGLLYKWAQSRGVKPRVLGQIFQFPHGRGSPGGIVHHEPNHDNHLHVRFRCAKADADCY